jgi:ribosomal protein S18 acetylase RimI-like enzyme
MPFEIRPYQEPDITNVVALWERCGLVVPQNDPHKDIAAKIRFQPDLFLIAQLDWQLVGTVMAGYEGHRGWLNYLAVDPEHQRKGYGRLLVEAAEHKLADLGCPKVNLQIRGSNKQALAFYRAIGYVTEDRIGMGKRIVLPEANEE